MTVQKGLSSTSTVSGPAPIHTVLNVICNMLYAAQEMTRFFVDGGRGGVLLVILGAYSISFDGKHTMLRARVTLFHLDLSPAEYHSKQHRVSLSTSK